MTSIRRLVWVWGALHLSVGSGLMGITHAFLERTAVTQSALPLIVGAVGALMSAVVLLHRYPELEFSVVRRFGFFTLVLLIIGNAVAADGLYAPAGESSPLTVGLLWLASMAAAYELSAGGRYERVLKRLAFR